MKGVLVGLRLSLRAELRMNRFYFQERFNRIGRGREVVLGPKREQRQFRPVRRALTDRIDRRCETEPGLGPSCHGRVAFSSSVPHNWRTRSRILISPNPRESLA